MSGWGRTAAVVACCFALGVGVAWLLFAYWLGAPPSHVVQGLRYLLVSGLVSLAVGVAALLVGGRWLPRLGLKIASATLFGSAAAIVNVVVMPLLMFSERSDKIILVITLLYFVAISLGFAVLVGAITSRQIRDLHAGALRLAGGELGTRVPVHGADEVADLARAFNRMSAEMSRSFERERQLEQGRRDLMAAVSHDLRTPLASIRAMVEAIDDGVVSDGETTSRYLRTIRRETERLGTLIDDLFELARIESGSLELRLASVPVAELIADTVDGLQPRAEEKGVRLEARCVDSAPAMALDGPRMQRALSNLVENAVRHTPAGGSVTVEVGRREGRLLVTVADTGEGIAAEDQPHIFDRFYRGEKSRSRDTGGAGLGLAIARGIVEAHHGTLAVESAQGEGSRFVMTL